jgi:DNA-nicking Smr family endonuclease
VADDSDQLRHRPFAPLADELRRRSREERRQARRALLASVSRQPPPEPPEPPAAAAALAVAAELDDAEVFAREMRGVAQLPRDNYVAPPREVAAAAPPRDEEAEVMAALADLVSGRSVFDLTASDEYIEGLAQGLDRGLLKKLRQGQFAVQAHLDLHGKTRALAREAVEAFVVDSRQRGRRCVLIVHGRGLNSKDQIPVLKEGLKVWLARGRIARSVLGFCTARPVDGGAGAVYVLLRR